MNPIKLVQNVFHSLIRNRGLKNEFKPRGHYVIEHTDKDGKLIGIYKIPNGIADVGATALLDSFFRNQTQPAAWYIALVDNSGFSAFAAADTMSSHAGWTESTVYSGGARVAWGPAAAAARSISNSVAATFNITGSATLHGIFVTSNNTLSGTTGTLWSTAAFSSNVTVSNGDQLKITYTIND